MKLLDYLVSVAEWWLALASIATLAFCFAVSRYKARQRADITRRAAYPPPVPRPRPVDDLLADQPTDVWLTDDLCDRLFDDLIAMEGLQ